MASKPDHRWQRLWLRLSATSFPTRATIGEARIQAAAVPLSNLREFPCLILLGAPGLGKSSEIRLAAHDAISRAEASDLISLGRLSGPGELEARLLTNAKNSQLTQKIWNIFLDGLDEALPQFTKDDNAIASAFRSLAQVRDLSTVRLRITCRSAEWPRMLESDLADLWGAPHVQTYELQELNDADVELAASQFPPEEAKRFLEQIRRNEVEALLLIPLSEIAYSRPLKCF